MSKQSLNETEQTLTWETRKMSETDASDADYTEWEEECRFNEEYVEWMHEHGLDEPMTDLEIEHIARYELA